MKKVKVWTSFEDQVKKLRERDCNITNEADCIEILGRVNYYRLTGYLYIFRDKAPEREDKFVPGTSLEGLLAIYQFDSELRRLLLVTLEKVEIFLRTQISHFHSEKYGPLGYLCNINHHKATYHHEFLNKFEKSVSEDNHTVFLKHHKREYNGQIPLWVAIELFSFGMLSKYYKNFTFKDKSNFSKVFYAYTNPNEQISLIGDISTWIHCCSLLRNKCAHYDRLYGNIVFDVIPSFKEHKEKADHSLFSQVLAVRACYPECEQWNQYFVNPLRDLLKKYTNFVELEKIGFPSDWFNRLIK